MYDILELNKKLLSELREIAKELKIKRVESFKKQDLIYKILDTQAIVVSESKAAKKDNTKKDSPNRDNSRKAKGEAVSEETKPAPKKDQGDPKRRRSRSLR
jgi:transcription termination factor Rho